MKMMRVRFPGILTAPWLGCVGVGLLLSGCLSRPALKRQTFALLDPPPGQTNTAPQGAVLQLRSVEVSPLFAGRALVYRTGQDAYELDPYAGFLVRPDGALAIPLRSYLRNSGLFRDVVEPGSPIKADEFLEVHVSEFYGDFRKSETPGAVVTLRFVLVQPSDGGGSRIGLNREYSRRVPLKSNTAEEVVAGYDEALAQIMKELVTDLTQAQSHP
jgi:cholesterol transport system auxiliary component